MIDDVPESDNLLTNSESTYQDLLLKIITELNNKNELLKFKISLLEKQLADTDKTILEPKKLKTTNVNTFADKADVIKRRPHGPVASTETDAVHS